MIGKARSILSCILAMLLCCTFVPAPALAEVASSKAPAFREDCFTCSSFDGCTHLAELSTRLVFDTKEPGKAKTHLEDLGYKNVSANAYESQGIRNLADSMGVTVGMRTICQNGVPYTLLAVITRSFYREEWVGDFTIDNGAMHAGFKDARDEILRYLRDYVQKQNITGNLKVWIAGHSRSAAASGLVAGFLADEGNAYLGNGISLAPEDIYAYCTATPAYIVDGASKDEVLSVSAARTTDPDYGAHDTPGAAYVHTGGGTIDLSADAYKGIRNYDLDTDFVAKLPPSAWGHKRYGVKIDASGEKTTIDGMAAELSKVSKDWFDAFQAGADPRKLTWVSLDPLKLNLDKPVLDLTVMKPTPAFGDGNLQSAIENRINGLLAAAPTRDAYVNGGYQRLLQVFSHVITSNAAGDLSTLPTRAGSRNLFKSVLFGHLAYARERLGVQSDVEAARVVLPQLVTYLTGQDVSKFKTTDELLIFLTKFLDENSKTPLVDSLLNRAATSLAKNPNAEIIKFFLSPFHPQGSDGSALVGQSEIDERKLTESLAEVIASLLDALVPGVPAAQQTTAPIALVASADSSSQSSDQETFKTLILDVVRACHKGPDPTSEAGQSGITDENVRALIYNSVALLVGSDKEIEGILTAIDSGRGTINDVIDALMPLFMRYKTKDDTFAFYKSFADAADGNFRLAATSLIADPKTAKDMADLAPQFRTFINNVLNTVNGRPYDLNYSVCILSTLITQYKTFIISHTNECYIAWAAAVNMKEETIHKNPQPTPTPGDNYGKRDQDVIPVSGYRGQIYDYDDDDSSSLADDTDAVPHTRLGGNDRYDTMAKISCAAFEKAEVAIVATGTDFADALAAAGLAGAYGAPIVLTDGTSLSAQAALELTRLGCTKVLVVGGPSAVSEAVTSAIADMNIAVERIAGASRTATSLAIMAAIGGAPQRVVIASGSSFADALSIASWCYATRTPIILTDASGLLSEDAIEAIQGTPSVQEAVVVGGTNMVGDVEGQLAGIVSTIRLAGQNRYETCAKVANWVQNHGLTWARVALASGTSFPDALAGSALAGSKGAITLLCSDSSDEARSALAGHAGSVKELLVLGGNSAVSDSLVSKLARVAY